MLYAKLCMCVSTGIYMGIPTLMMCSASAEMPNGYIWGVTAVFPQLAAKVTPKSIPFAKRVPNA